MRKAQESLEVATQENKALTDQIKFKNDDLKRFALRSMCMKIELVLSEIGLSRYSRTKRSFEKWSTYCQERSKEEHAMSRILRKFCHDKYFSVAFHHWVNVTQDLAREETRRRNALNHVISRAMLFRERKMQKCWSMWKNQTLRVSHSIYTKNNNDMKTRVTQLEKERAEAESKLNSEMELRNAKIAFLESSLNRQVKDRMRSAISTLTSTYVLSETLVFPYHHTHSNKPGTCVQMMR